MFGSFAHQVAGAEYYRSPRHLCNGSAGGDAFVPAPVGVPVAALSSTVFAGRAPIPRHGGHLVPGGSAVAGRPGAVAWGMIGVEVINSAAACLEAPPTARPPVPIHVINLKHRPERWGRCQALELDPRLRLERFNAVATLRGWVGCARSHLQLIRDARARGDLWVVVAEDDFVPTLPPKLWADHLLSVLDAIEQPDAQFDVFNSLPSGRWTGQLVTPAGPGLWRVNGGANTHLMVYSARMFEMAEQWEVDLRAVESRPGGRVNAECVMAWDRWIGATARVATKVPHITATTLDTSDIVPGGVITGQAAMHMAEVVGGLWDIKWLHAGREWPATVRLRFVAVPSALAQAGDARRQPWSAGAAAVASADFSHGVGPRDRQQPPRAAAVGSGGSGGAGGGRVVEMEEDYDALLAADESDCIEDDPAYQLMLVRVPAPVTWRPVAAILVSRSEGLAGIEGKAKPWEAV